jgi:hypothetical protein
MTDSEAMLAIQELLDGVAWTADLGPEIAAIMVQAGYRIRDRDDRDDPVIPQACPATLSDGSRLSSKGALKRSRANGRT